MSINVELRVVQAGDSAHVEEAWALKERIRETEGVLKQRRGFFTRAYHRARCQLLFAGDELVGFTSARGDGYILFLAIAPDFRGEGHGERLVGAVADECGAVTCHARVSNEDALGFYDHLGFEVVRRIDGYYEDGGDAYYLRLGERERLLDRISEFFTR